MSLMKSTTKRHQKLREVNLCQLPSNKWLPQWLLRNSPKSRKLWKYTSRSNPLLLLLLLKRRQWFLLLSQYKLLLWLRRKLISLQRRLNNQKLRSLLHWVKSSHKKIWHLAQSSINWFQTLRPKKISSKNKSVIFRRLWTRSVNKWTWKTSVWSSYLRKL